MKKYDKVKITRAGRYFSELGTIEAILETTEERKIVEVKIDHDYLFDPVEYVLVFDNEIETINKQ